MRTQTWKVARFTSMVVFALCLGPGQASAGDYQYETNNGTITITGYTGPGGDVSIPGEVDGLPVASIGDKAFYGCGSLTSVVIPNSVTSIRDWAFYYCSRLTSITIPSSVATISDNTFAECYSLTNVTIPDSVTSIGRGAFLDCESLTSVTISDNVTNIGDRAFSWCTSLTGVTIPNSVTSIGDWVFSDCASLSAITVDTNNPAFSSLGGVMFNKNQTTLVQYPAGKEGSQYTIPNTVTGIGTRAFWWTSLSSITIPSSVTGIGYGAFSHCNSLTNVTIPDSVTNIGRAAFFECDSLSSVTIGNSVTSIGDSAFSYCPLTRVTIGHSVISIGNEAFYCCTSLTGVSFTGNAPQVGSCVFCSSLGVTVYYLPGTTGWGANFSGRPTAVWVRPNPVILKSTGGIQNNAFGFRISWATNAPVVVEASTSLTTPSWSAISTNTLTEGWTDFSDPDWNNHPSRFYRVRAQ